MDGLKFLAIIFLLKGCHLTLAKPCQNETDISGEIRTYENEYHGYSYCWVISVPKGKYTRLTFSEFKTNHPCNRAYVKISVPEEEKEYTFCENTSVWKPVTALSNVTIEHRINAYKPPGVINPYYSQFRLQYDIFDLECVDKNSFHCDKHTCIPAHKRCDGIADCVNGTDEIGCEKGVLAVSGVAEAREEAIYWLKNQMNATRSGQVNTARAVVALYLASGANFSGTDLEEELMVNQVELHTMASLLRPSISNSDLSLFINALLVTCHNPRRFYGIDLVKRLKEQAENFTGNFTHPAVYLALCNAQEQWPFVKAIADFARILNASWEYPFARDLQAMAVMALSCKINSNKKHISSSYYDAILYEDTIKKFKESQLADGSFGNVYTTALITQALISSNEDLSDDWNLNATVKFLMNELNSSSVDFLSTYYTLPILNGKSLASISNINCSASYRKQIDDPESEIRDNLGPKIRVRYSLYIGDEKDIIHTIVLRVVENYTAFEVMKYAAVEDDKYKFQAKKMSESMYVYRIGKITNDSEAGKFWLLYVGSSNDTQSLEHLTTSPDKVALKDGDHLVFWYKTASL